MQMIGSNIIPSEFTAVYKWLDLEDDSPNEQIRNRWLWEFGAFAKYRHPMTNETIWFPAQVVAWDIQEKPSVIGAIRTSGNDTYNQIIANMLPTFVPVEELEAFYYCLPIGLSLRQWIGPYVQQVHETRDIIHQAVTRSLDTAVLLAPRRWGKHFKRALNALRKGEWYVLEGNPTEMENVKVIEIPTTAAQLTLLWDSYDWAKQEMYAKLGFSYNPEKRERMIQAEMMAQTQLLRANREFVTEQLVRCAELNDNGERVYHIVDYILNVEPALKANTVSLSLGADSTLSTGIFQDEIQGGGNPLG